MKFGYAMSVLITRKQELVERAIEDRKYWKYDKENMAELQEAIDLLMEAKGVSHDNK